MSEIFDGIALSQDLRLPIIIIGIRYLFLREKLKQCVATLLH